MLLTTIVFVPLIGAILVLLAGGRGDRPEREPMVRALALAVSLVDFLLTLWLWARFDAASSGFQFVEQHAWLPQFGISYHLGVDGISLFLLVLTGFLTPLALLTSWQSIHKNQKLFSFFLLALETAMLGVFVSPHFATDQSIYITYIEPGDYGGGQVLARAKLVTGWGVAGLRELSGQQPRHLRDAGGWF